MKKINLTELMVTPDSELLSIFSNHPEYSTPTLLYCYAEIKRRELALSETLLKAVSAGLKIDDFDSEVKKAAISRGFNSYLELYLSIIKTQKGAEPEQVTGHASSVPNNNINNISVQHNTDPDPKYSQINNQANSQYKVLPFNDSTDPAGTLQQIINNEALYGWRYKNHQYTDKTAPATTGCFGFGATPAHNSHVGFVIFEKS